MTENCIGIPVYAIFIQLQQQSLSKLLLTTHIQELDITESIKINSFHFACSTSKF